MSKTSGKQSIIVVVKKKKEKKAASFEVSSCSSN